ncbi:MAG: hypothetical protein ACLUB2_06195 [Butyricicoccus pullicaecorum]
MAALGDKTSSSLAANTVITAQTGTEITLQSGSAVVSQGTWLNLTTGKAVSAGSALQINQIYLAADDNVSQTVKGSSVLISGQYTTELFSVGLSSQYTAYADALQLLGLFQGTSKGYELNVPTRLEGIVMLIRLLKNRLRASYTGSHPSPMSPHGQPATSLTPISKAIPAESMPRRLAQP